MTNTRRADGPPHPVTPDGRYFVVRGRLWRMANPHLSESKHAEFVGQLMAARRNLRRDAPVAGREVARRNVDEAKQALGERGVVWWADGAPDYNRKLVRNTPYATWFASLEDAA